MSDIKQIRDSSKVELTVKQVNDLINTAEANESENRRLTSQIDRIYKAIAGYDPTFHQDYYEIKLRAREYCQELRRKEDREAWENSPAFKKLNKKRKLCQ